MTKNDAEIALAKTVAAILSSHGLHISLPSDGFPDDVQRERWNVCLEIARKVINSEPIDCREMSNDVPVVISQMTATAALSAMNDKAKTGIWNHLMHDESQFISIYIRELENAAKYRKGKAK